MCIRDRVNIVLSIIHKLLSLSVLAVTQSCSILQLLKTFSYSVLLSYQMCIRDSFPVCGASPTKTVSPLSQQGPLPCLSSFLQRFTLLLSLQKFCRYRFCLDLTFPEPHYCWSAVLVWARWYHPNSSVNTKSHSFYHNNENILILLSYTL